MKNILKTACVTFLVFALFVPAASQAQLLWFMENPLIGEQATDFTLQTTQGREETMSSLRGDKAAIIFFWATWCPHCRTQLRELHKNRSEIKGKGIELVFVDMGQARHNVEAYLKKQKIDFEVFLDKDSSVSQEYGIVGVPTFIYVDQNGLVQAVEHTLLKNYEQVLGLSE